MAYDAPDEGLDWTDEEDDWDEEPDEEEDDDTLLHRIERAYRAERVRVRDAESLAELRGLRTEYESLATAPGAPQAGRLRVRDLIALVDERITDLKALRNAARRP